MDDAETIFNEGTDYPEQKFDADKIEYDTMADKAAYRSFGIRYLFPWQRLVIANILDSAERIKAEAAQTESTDEVCRGRQIVLLPTGAGKSLCFLVPALLLDGPTLVLYPLLALMSDQQRRMESGSLSCVTFKGSQSAEEREENFNNIETGKARVILANPEVLQNEELVSRLAKCGIAHIAVDEAHCVSEWGDSFRPAYLTLGEIIKKLGVKVVTAFTATASPVVLARVAEVLFDKNAHLVRSAGDRPNIHYEVRYTYAKKKAVLRAAVEEKKPMIIFCGTRRRTEDTARLLTSYFGSGKAKFYHAGMTNKEKESVEQWFMESKDGILAATCAYGMGVDKGDILTVCHLDPPNHIENFIQEAGRAGRKGDNVKSILLWNHADHVHYRQTASGSREHAMGDFAELEGCRRQFMLDYLGDEKTTCSGCDWCDARRAGKKLSHNAEDAETAVSFIRKNRRFYDREEIVPELIKLMNQKDLNTFGVRVWEAGDIAELLSQLISEQRIRTCSGLWLHKLDIATNRKCSFIFSLMPRKMKRSFFSARRMLRLFLRLIQNPLPKLFHLMRQVRMATELF
jgi:ATP-dependent DNA helicase RecQ